MKLEKTELKKRIKNLIKLNKDETNEYVKQSRLIHITKYKKLIENDTQ